MPSLPDAGIWTLLTAAYATSVVIFIVLERRRPASTVAWLLVLLLLPVVGLPVYLLIGRRRVRRAKRMRRELAINPLEAMQDLRIVHEIPAELPPHIAGLVRLAQRTSLAAVRRADDVELYSESGPAFEAMLDAIDGAAHRIHLEFYIWRDDEAGRAMVRRLAAAAMRGVQVRVLYDALGSFGLPRSHFAPLEEHGGQVAAFSPLVSLPWARRRGARLDARNHRKLVCVDGTVGFAGGLNIADEYRDGRIGSSQVEWRDLWIRINGDLVLGLEAVFLEDWQVTTGTLLQPWEGVDGIEDVDLSTRPKQAGVSTGPVAQIIASGPDLGEASAVTSQFISAISMSQRRCWICTPYFIPDETLIASLRIASLRGVDVRICVPSGRYNDVWVVGMAARSYYDPLLAAGCKIYEFDAGMIHAKYLIIDEHVSTVGSANFDLRSLHINYEVSVMFYDEGVTTNLARVFEDTLERATAVEPESRANLNLPTRIAEGLARTLSPLF